MRYLFLIISILALSFSKKGPSLAYAQTYLLLAPVTVNIESGDASSSRSLQTIGPEDSSVSEVKVRKTSRGIRNTSIKREGRVIFLEYIPEKHMWGNNLAVKVHFNDATVREAYIDKELFENTTLLFDIPKFSEETNVILSQSGPCPPPQEAYIHYSEIPGFDKFLEPYEIQNEHILDLVNSTAAMVRKDRIRRKPGRGGGYQLEETEGNFTDICALAEFYKKQKKIATCGGTLIDENKILTAGHCINSDDDCSSYVWVFDYRVKEPGQEDSSSHISGENIFQCKRVLKREIKEKYVGGHVHVDRIDYAIVEVDRPVKGRRIFDISNANRTDNDAKLVAIGYPNGLPVKISPVGSVIDNNEDYSFTTNVVAFNSNSGGPVFNVETMKIEGIASGTRGLKPWAIEGHPSISDMSCSIHWPTDYSTSVSRLTNIEYAN